MKAMSKRAASSKREGIKKAPRMLPMVDPRRVRTLKGSKSDTDAPVLYWLARDQRSVDNWALLYAVEEAQRTRSPIGVTFALVEPPVDYSLRQLSFMIRGLELLESKLAALNIPFFFFKGSPEETLPALAKSCQARLVVMDYSPLRGARSYKQAVVDRLECCAVEVDAHNIVPMWVVSDKREYAAHTIRRKLDSLLDEFLTDYPSLEPLERNTWPEALLPEATDWLELQTAALRLGDDLPQVTWFEPGEDAGNAALEAFLGSERIKNYGVRRNNPVVEDGQSNLSPFLHFGFLSAQRVAYEAHTKRHTYKVSVESFLEELIVRRELSDNFCHHASNYDAFEAATDWARATLNDHLDDERSYLYTQDQFETAETHDDLWNACQKELIYRGKIHGYMRMYWAKKVLEWSPTPSEALETSIYLNDKYSLDGHDPNGYVGCQWCITGIHDRAHREIAVTGKIRVMTYGGCKRKFGVKAYIDRVAELEKQAKNGL